MRVFGKMNASLLCAGVIFCLSMLIMLGMAQPTPDKEKLLNELSQELVEDDGSIDRAVIDYLYAKQLFNRLRAQAGATEIQGKRSYWKQCAFNAVSCFGQKREGSRRLNFIANNNLHGRWDFLANLFRFRK
uniref:Putative prohormone-1 n=1 Tax=Panstrongylus lignarius TaxID=156445 RepID=A0A224XWI6_9HEMI